MSNIIVQKFGGTSVGSEERIASVAKIVQKASLDNSIVVVVSAMSGETNRLINLAKSFGDNPSKREFDALISTGEKVSAALLAMALQQIGVPAKSFSASQISMKTTNTYSKARILEVDGNKIQETLDAGIVPIITGFQGITESGDVTTLGRGGSDTTAVALASALDAEQCEIYTDVDGIYSADPRIVKNSILIPKISYEDMLEMASLGAKMHPRSIEIAAINEVKMRIKHSEKKGEGTLLSKKDSQMEVRNAVTGIPTSSKVSKITLNNIEDKPGIAASIFSPLSAKGISVDVIVQTASLNGSTNLSFTLSDENLDKCISILKKRDVANDSNIKTQKGLGKVSIVGTGIQNQAGYASRMFETLANNNINIEMITTSEIRITCIIKDSDLSEAANCLHKEFID